MLDFEAQDFFKYYLVDESFQTMLIPPGVALHSCKRMPVAATFRNGKGQYWHVEVDEIDNEMHFKKGWRKFVEQNSIKDGNFLVFSYVGFSVFDVRVFGSDKCERSVSHLMSDEQEMEHVVKQEQEEDVDEVQEEEHGDQMEFEEEEEEKSDDDYCQEQEDNEIYPENYVQELNPYFIAKTRLRRKNELYVPLDVIRDFDLTFEDKEEIIFLDPHKREKIGKVVQWKDGRICITGWRSFCNLNKVDYQRDTCICEVLLDKEQEDETRQKRKVIQVHIVRPSRKGTQFRKPSSKN